MTIESARIACPYCGETIEVLVDRSIERQRYVEDCEVCCRPMVLTAIVGADGGLAVNARDEDDPEAPG